MSAPASPFRAGPAEPGGAVRHAMSAPAPTGAITAHRPDPEPWPAAVVARLADRLSLPGSATVVEVGAGALTRPLAERFARVVAVAAPPVLRGLIPAGPAGVTVCDGAAGRLPLPDGSAQAVFLTGPVDRLDPAAALAEAARVLAPEGVVCLLRREPTGPWTPEPPEPVRPLLEAAVSDDADPWREAFAGSAFGPTTLESVVGESIVDCAGLIAEILSTAPVANLPEPEWDDLRTRLAGQLTGDAAYRRPVRVELCWTRLQPVRWCGHCGRELAGLAHDGCAVVRELEPPRYCRHCRRRMRVQVLPAGWQAYCSAHGEIRTG